MKDLKNQRILAVAPHTDDGELGCGATIAKALAAGAGDRYNFDFYRRAELVLVRSAEQLFLRAG